MFRNTTTFVFKDDFDSEFTKQRNMSDPPKKQPPLPSWQQSHNTESGSPETEYPHGSDPTTQTSHAELLEQARDFLKDGSIRDAPREKKVSFLESKGLKGNDIELLLNESPTSSTSQREEEIKTVHDSNSEDEKYTIPTTTATSEAPSQPSPPTEEPPQQPQRDLAPIITYPEFLLKPQKPPPLITIPRLINAAYIFGGLATLTYGASKYLVEPMLETLTEARHSLASTTLADLEKLNDKLESSVSHIPYIASAAARKSQDQARDGTSDDESTTSDPTELFHRDIATQTTPTLSRVHSQSDEQQTHLDATTQQVVRLSSLNDTLTSLVEMLDPKEVPYLPPAPDKKLRETVSDFQAVLDKLESTYNPLRGDYYSNIYAQPADNKGKSGKDGGDVAAKVRTEIRSLKGAFLSARNFPTAPRPASSYVGR